MPASFIIMVLNLFVILALSIPTIMIDVLVFVLMLCRYALKVGELSEPVFTDSGIHLILRTA